jgi:hypothetical protein
LTILGDGCPKLLFHMFINDLPALQTSFVIQNTSGYSPHVHLHVSIIVLVF